MKVFQVMIVLIILFLSFQTVSGFEIEAYKITAAPSGESVANVIELTIHNTKETALSQGTLHIAKDASLVSIRDSYGNIASNITENKDKKDKTLSFTFSIPVQPGEKRVLTLETKTHNVVQKEGYFEYILVLVPPNDVDNFVHILKLDKGVELYSIREEYLIIPDATITETEEHMVIQWERSLTKDDPTLFLARFSQEAGINYWKWSALSLVAVLFCLISGYGFERFYSYRRQQKALKATNFLNEREKAVLRLVIKNPEIKQYEIIKMLGYTKSNMSKIIKRLEFRGLISVKKEGKIRILTVGEKMQREI